MRTPKLKLRNILPLALLMSLTWLPVTASAQTADATASESTTEVVDTEVSGVEAVAGIDAEGNEIAAEENAGLSKIQQRMIDKRLNTIARTQSTGRRL